MTKTITLGGQDYPIAPLTLGQMRRAGPCLTRIGIDTPEGVAAQTTLIALAMQAADPMVTPEVVDSIRGVTFEELRKAVDVVAGLMGVAMVRPGMEVSATQGEAPPVAGPAA